MDAISAVAASAQLIGYCYSANRALVGVIKDIKEGPSAYNDQTANIQLLLMIVGQLSEHTVESDEGKDIVISLIIDISELASKARNLMNERSSLIKTVLNSSARRSAIVATFDALSAKRELLQLVLTRNNSLLLSTINQQLGADNSKKSLESNVKSMGSVLTRHTMDSEINANNARVTNYSTIEIGAVSEDLGALDLRTLGGTIRRRINAAGATVQDWSRMWIGKKRDGANGGDMSGQEEAAHMPPLHAESAAGVGVLMEPSNFTSGRKVPIGVSGPESARLPVEGPFPSKTKCQTHDWEFEGYDSP
ncbi:hypothetical protein F5Y13DRAFT_191175 [Hypoxylon sp. FL1857]|nr:hypothetical protein F5Y13DRAFT_191175 [Hypoxylon sp. FL1857]